MEGVKGGGGAWPSCREKGELSGNFKNGRVRIWSNQADLGIHRTDLTLPSRGGPRGVGEGLGGVP